MVGQILGAGVDTVFLGSKDALVNAQELLAELGYSGPADGVVGAKTRAAIRNFETSSGLPTSGQVSEALYDQLVLNQIIACKPK